MLSQMSSDSCSCHVRVPDGGCGPLFLLDLVRAFGKTIVQPYRGGSPVREILLKRGAGHAGLLLWHSCCRTAFGTPTCVHTLLLSHLSPAS